MKKFHKMLLIVLLFALLILPTVALVTAQGEMIQVRYGVSPFQDTLLPVLGQEMGWYEEEGLDVEFVILGWTEVQEALAAGQVDVAINNETSVIATHQNFNFVYWYGFNIFTEGAALMGRPEFKTADEFEAEGMTREEAIQAAVEQLRDRTVVTTGNTDMEQAVLTAATNAGLEAGTDFEVIDLNPDEGLAAFLSGTGDFYLGGIPQRTRLTQEGMKAIVTGPELAPPPINGIITTPAYAEENQDVMLKLLRVWFRIVNYTQENTEEAGQMILDILNAQTGANMTVDNFVTFWQNYEHFPLNPAEIQRDILDPEGYAYWRARWDATNDYFVNVTGTLNEAVDPAGVFLMEEAQAAYIEAYGEE
ncbi:ABC transporter substrate-binding protein [Oscillatoria laete-virens NRMC-F 0139]|jgi:ABC-type nitrate/sulfonate/bicarbonate transport system substrate-binding protein|nr:ABC transporter substrate-binding protein [Oscillatoria laete-virens]MDL5054615.1 ABC transporter substrate-binding protein [Oscillatoria laete-virens NRMC-F 0139]